MLFSGAGVAGKGRSPRSRAAGTEPVGAGRAAWPSSGQDRGRYSGPGGGPAERGTLRSGSRVGFARTGGGSLLISSQQGQGIDSPDHHEAGASGHGCVFSGDSSKLTVFVNRGFCEADGHSAGEHRVHRHVRVFRRLMGGQGGLFCIEGPRVRSSSDLSILRQDIYAHLRSIGHIRRCHGMRAGPSAHPGRTANLRAQVGAAFATHSPPPAARAARAASAAASSGVPAAASAARASFQVSQAARASASSRSHR